MKFFISISVTVKLKLKKKSCALVLGGSSNPEKKHVGKKKGAEHARDFITSRVCAG